MSRSISALSFKRGHLFEKNVSIRFFVLMGLVAGGLHAVASTWFKAPLALSGGLSILALMVLGVAIMRSPNFWRAALAGWVFSIVWLCSAVWWLYVSMHQYGGLPAPLAVLAVFLLCSGLGLFYGLAAGLARKASPKGELCAVAFAVCWMLADMARGWIFTGFPWAATGYTHTDSWLVTFAPWVGVYGLSGVCAFVAALLLLLLRTLINWRRQANPALYATMAVVLLAAVSSAAWFARIDFTKDAGNLKVALLQGNISQDLKFDPIVAGDAFSWYVRELVQAKEGNVQFVLMPETAVPFLPANVPEPYWDSLREQAFATGQMAALIGIPMQDKQNQITNSMLGLSAGADYRYDKYHLVPFGEFIPKGFDWFVKMMSIPLGNMGRGEIDAPSFSWGGQVIVPNICYEDLFGEELAKRFSSDGQEPTIMANASNIAWFGDTVALPQHLQIARMRALEFQRPMIRATNTGVTAIINHQGVVEQALPVYTQGVLVGEVNGRQGLTPYAWWASQWGLLPLWAAGLFMLLLLLFLRRGRN